MKMINKRRIVLFLAFFSLVVLGITGCSGENKKTEEDKDGYSIYYSTKDKTKLVSVSYKPQSSEPSKEALVEELLCKVNEQPDKMDCIVAKGELVEVNKWEVSKNILKIDYGYTYNDMDSISELLYRAAVVLTLTQIRGIEYVTFTVNNQPLMDSSQNPVNSMKASDFVDIAGSSINQYQEIKLILYYANKSGDKLIPVSYSGLAQQNTSMEKLIIERLISGSPEPKTYRTVPADLNLISVNTKDGICYVNFDQSFLEDFSDVTPKVEIYSIVNSLTELTYINEVQISINGKTDEEFRKYKSLKYAFTRNLDIVEE